MPRQYQHIKQHENQIWQWRNEGKTLTEIAKILGLENKRPLEELITRHNRKKAREAENIPHQHRGRPRKSLAINANELQLRIKELERELELYKSLSSRC